MAVIILKLAVLFNVSVSDGLDKIKKEKTISENTIKVINLKLMLQRIVYHQ